MNLQTVLREHNFPEGIQKLFADSGIKHLYPPQAEAIRKGVLSGRNLIMSVPTAAGKTLIAELCILKSVFDKGGRALYIAPLKALANEKFEDFQKKYESQGLQVGLATGDFEASDKTLARHQILIATAEKVDALLRSRSQGLVTNLSVVVLDEIHFINDGVRGPTMEILAARIKQLNPNIQILALSATVKNAKELADWLKADCVVSDWRPIPLREGVYFNETVKFNTGPAKLIKEDTTDDLSKLTLDTLRGGGQVLVFVNSRRSAQAAGRQIAKDVVELLKEDEKCQLAALAKEIEGSPADSTKICRHLAQTVRMGAAFHHAGLKPKQRRLIEENFKKNLIKVICSTPTLAAGVNLPARRAIVRDVKRFESGLGSAYIPTSEYKQCAGRAGRPQYDEYGEAVLLAKSSSEMDTLFDRYINAEPEPVISKLGEESALRVHVLSSIAGGFVHDVSAMFEFLSHTLLVHQKRADNLIDLISRIFEFLQKEGFIERTGFKFFATPFGQYTSRLYIDPMTALVLRDGLKKMQQGKSFSNIGLLHLMGCCPDTPLMHVSQGEAEDLQAFASKCQDEFILTKKDLSALDDFFISLSILKNTWLLASWIEEEKEETICDRFNIGPGDIYRVTDTAQWLLEATAVFADLFQYKKLTFLLNQLKMRLQYGIKEELLELTQLKGVGRIRARNLYQAGFKKLADLKYTSADELAGVTQIGKTIAKEILTQVHANPAKLTAR